MPHAYTEDQQAPRTLTRPLPRGEEVEQPAKAGGPPSPWPSPNRRGNDGLFAELGWATVSALEELFGRSRGDETQLSPAESQSLLTSSPTICLGRETKGEVVLVSRLRAAQSAVPNPQPGLLATLLPLGEGPGDEGAQLTLPPEAITAAVDELTRDLLLPRLLSGQVTLPVQTYTKTGAQIL